MEGQMRSMEQLLEEVQKVVVELRQTQDVGWDNLTKIMPNITKVYQQLLDVANSGVDLPLDILLQQLENLESAYMQKDMVIIADTLEYEVREGICFYIEILKCMG